LLGRIWAECIEAFFGAKEMLDEDARRLMQIKGALGGST
jgi:hypothetical protein